MHRNAVGGGPSHGHMQYTHHCFYGSMDFVRDNPGEPVPEETFTHSYLLWSSIVPYLFHPYTSHINTQTPTGSTLQNHVT